MAQLNPATKNKIEEIIKEKRLDMLIDIKNPLDINPAADDEAHALISEILLEDAKIFASNEAPLNLLELCKAFLEKNK